MKSSLRLTTVGFTQLFLLIFVLGAAAQAQKIKVDYDKSLDFAKFQTFAFGPQGPVSHPMLALAVVGAVQDQLTKRGLRQVESDPDVFVEIYGSIDTDLGIHYSNPLYSGMGGIPAFGTSFVMWGNVTGGVSAVTIHKGQLVVDVINASQKKLAWRGMATDKLSSNKDKLVDQINTSVEKMFRQYPTAQ